MINCLVEVITSQEEAKFGVTPNRTLEIAKQICTLPGIKIRGLMTNGAFLAEREEVHPCFKLLKELKDQIHDANLAGVEVNFLSMGMTNDFEVGIEQGSNMIRLGRAIFGERY